MAAFFAAQSVITLALYLVCGVLSLLSIPLTGSYGYAISDPVAFALYAAIWGGLWYASYRTSGMQHFTPKLAAATLPLVALTAVYVLRQPKTRRPHDDPHSPAGHSLPFCGGHHGDAALPLVRDGVETEFGEQSPRRAVFSAHDPQCHRRRPLFYRLFHDTARELASDVEAPSRGFSPNCFEYA